MSDGPSILRGARATTRGGLAMTSHAVAHIDEIEEASDGRCPWRPVRHHLGITAFDVSTWTGRDAGDRILNEDDELTREPGHLRAEDVEDDANEDLYLVYRGRARFEFDDEQVDAPAGTFVFVPPGVKRTAFAEEPGTTIVAVGGVPGKAYEPVGWEIWRPLHPAVRVAPLRGGDRPRPRPDRSDRVPRAALQPRLLREPHGRNVRGDRTSPTRA